MTNDERKAAILAAARKHPKGLRRDDLLKTAGVNVTTGYQSLTELKKVGELVNVKAGSAVLWALPEHEATVYGEAQKMVAKPRRWPETSSWTPPQPRIPSVWHLGLL